MTKLFTLDEFMEGVHDYINAQMTKEDDLDVPIISYLKRLGWDQQQAGMPEKLEVYNNLFWCLKDIGDVMERFYDNQTEEGRQLYRNIRAMRRSEPHD